MRVVIAGSYRQYMNYCRENRIDPIKGAVYVTDSSALEGLQDIDPVYIGTWRDHTREWLCAVSKMIVTIQNRRHGESNSI